MNWYIGLLLFAAHSAAAVTAWLTACAFGLSGAPAVLTATALWVAMAYLGRKIGELT